MKNNNVFDYVDFGILQRYLELEDVTDLACKNHGEIWITSNTNGHHRVEEIIQESEIERIANQIANKMQKEFNPSHPNLEGDVQGKLEDYRIGCVHSYLSPLGITLVIRKVRKNAFLTFDGLVTSKTISKDALNMLILSVKGKANILIIGETGSGKTELLKFLIRYIPKTDVVVTIEDSMEFNVKNISPQLSSTAFRVRDNFSYRELLSMSLRLNVQRILLQEARGKEVSDLMDAMATGHSVMTTMHARYAESIPSRIKQMLKDDVESYDSLKKRVYDLVDLVVHVEKVEINHSVYRKVQSIVEFDYDPVTNNCQEYLVYENGKALNSLSKKLIKRLAKNLMVEI